MAQKRRHQRHGTILYLQVYARPSHEKIARLVDISDEGALLLSENTFSLEEPIEASIESPKMESKEGTEIPCTLTPRWQKPDYNPDFLLTGCTMEVSSGARRLLEELMWHYGFDGETSDFLDYDEEE